MYGSIAVGLNGDSIQWTLYTKNECKSNEGLCGTQCQGSNIPKYCICVEISSSFPKLELDPVRIRGFSQS